MNSGFDGALALVFERSPRMKNAHERFGWLEFEKQLKDTRTRLRVALDRFISEPAENKEASGTCHLVSVFGNDVDIEIGRAHV